MSDFTKIAILATATVLLTAGCASQNCGTCSKQSDALGDDFLPPLADGNVTGKVGMQQAASGARADCVLRAHHFHGGKLNSLGERKLSLILSDDDQSLPLTLYFDMPDTDPTAVARREAAVAYLKSHGIPEEQVKLASGSNPNNGVPTAPLLKNLNKTDSAADASAGGAGMTGTN